MTFLPKNLGNAYFDTASTAFRPPLPPPRGKDGTVTEFALWNPEEPCAPAG